MCALSLLAMSITISSAIGCGGGSSAPDAGSDAGLEPCPIGDLSAAPELEIVHLDASFRRFTTEAMGTLPLQAPPQGGWIALIGARARNLDCQLQLTAALVDSVDHRIIQIDQRPTTLEVGADGWGVSSDLTYSNLPVCPQPTATRDLHGVPYLIKVSVEDANGKRAAAELTVTPTCPADLPRCACECAEQYVLGDACPPA